MSVDFEQASWATETFKPANGKVVVMFRTTQKKDNHQSMLQQRPVFKEVVHIVKIPADQFLRIDRPVSEEDKEEFPAEWERFVKTKETRALGTPLDNWHSISDTQKAEFKAMGVHTIEQFANLPDSWKDKMMGFDRWRQMARTFVESGKDAELVSKIREEANAEVSAMRKRMEDMEAMLAELTAKKKSKD